MLLDATTRKIQIVLAGAITTNQLNVCAAYVDMTSSATTPGTKVANSNSTTAVDVVDAPGSSTQRKVNSISIYNADTASATVTVRYNDNSTPYPIVKVAVPSGYTLQYADTEGWTMISSSGIIQVAGPAGANGADGIAKVAGINVQTGTSYTLALSDVGWEVNCSNASPFTLNVPPNSSVAFPVGTVVLFSQGGAGAVTATDGGGVTLRAPNGAATTSQYDARGLQKIATDTWRVW